jgi:GntR family transcriptional repressor for pyruvate dehydrogenase complex
LEEMIHGEALKVGDKLPSEQELAEKFGVSRNILREALKTLKERGLISVRTGDGSYVAKPKPEILTNVVTRLIRLSDVTLRDVIELRSAIEVVASGLAAERAEPADIDELRVVITSMEAHREDVDRWAQAELRFHRTVANATKNPLFPSFIQALSSHLYNLFVEGYHKPTAAPHGIAGHKAILNAIKARDKKKAEKAMLTHLEISRKLLLGEDS